MHERCRNIMFFKGMTDTEISECLMELKYQNKKYKKDEIIMSAGNTTESMGVVLAGSVTIESNDSWGNCTILSHVGTNGFFAETYAMLEEEVMLVDVRANEDCEILFLNLNVIRNNTNYQKLWQYKLVANLLNISIHKNIMLSRRSFHTSPHTIRGKIYSYLNSIELQKHSSEFDIPFDRQQLADYLNVERTALSKELGKMKKEKLIDFKKNHFVIYKERE